MTVRTISLLTLLCLVGLSSASCYTRCRFRVCSNDPVLKLGAPDGPLTYFICRLDKPVGIVNSGEAFIRTGGRFTRISKYCPHGLKQKFSNHFFKTYSISGGTGSGVGHEVPQRRTDVDGWRVFIDRQSVFF